MIIFHSISITFFFLTCTKQQTYLDRVRDTGGAVCNKNNKATKDT